LDRTGPCEDDASREKNKNAGQHDPQTEKAADNNIKQPSQDDACAEVPDENDAKKNKSTRRRGRTKMNL